MATILHLHILTHIHTHTYPHTYPHTDIPERRTHIHTHTYTHTCIYIQIYYDTSIIFTSIIFIMIT